MRDKKSAEKYNNKNIFIMRWLVTMKAQQAISELRTSSLSENEQNVCK
jgi:hypothetical protein